jgi:pimeloyl-ACP methyl ester carboxylesterase
MEGEVAEVGYWVNWLYKKGYKEIVLTGFSSSGNHAILAYNAQGPHPAVKLAILTNLNPNYSDDMERQKTSPAANGKNLSKYRLGFCKNNFTATADSYLSYAQYDENRLLALLKNTTVRTEVVFGSADPILPPNWADRIRALHSPTQVRIIKNANHFFDGTQEFDLAEEVENILKNITAR